jgi:hypothetical protein
MGLRAGARSPPLIGMSPPLRAPAPAGSHAPAGSRSPALDALAARWAVSGALR